MAERIMHQFNRRGGRDITRAPRELMDEIYMMVERKERVEAINLIRDAIADYPQDAYLYMHAATTFTKLGEEADNHAPDTATAHWQASLEYALTGLKINPNDVRLLTQCAKNYKLLGEYDNAEGFFRRAIRIADDDKFTWAAMGDLFATWAYDENITDLTDVDVSNLMQDAVNCYAKSFSLDPDNKGILYKLNDFAKEGFRPTQEGYDMGDEALAIINNAVAVKPQNLPVPAPAVPSGPTLDSL